MFHKEFTCELYKCKILFYAGCGHNEFMEHAINNYNIVFENDDWNTLKGCAFSCDVKGTTIYGIWIRKKKDYEALYHECLHLTYRIFRDRNIPVGFNNEETVAYYLGHWSNKLRKDLGKRKKVSTKRKK